MSRYALNLPAQLKQDAENWAHRQGISLNQFILWAVAEKVGVLSQGLDDPNFPSITWKRGAAGHPTPLLRGTGIRVQTIVLACRHWGLSIEQVAADYDLTERQVKEALAFYEAHPDEIEANSRAEERMEARQVTGGA
jgi:uncharacterized protein (DUF433 family)